jgi:DNA-binding XRE family transcriptional regulator
MRILELGKWERDLTRGSKADDAALSRKEMQVLEKEKWDPSLIWTKVANHLGLVEI